MCVDFKFCSKIKLHVYHRYITKLKALWEELGGYKPILLALVGKSDFFLITTIPSMWCFFFMCRHDISHKIIGYILLKDPIPPINKVFSLVMQGNVPLAPLPQYLMLHLLLILNVLLKSLLNTDAKPKHGIVSDSNAD